MLEAAQRHLEAFVQKDKEPRLRAEMSESSILSPTSVLIQEVGILILVRILFVTQPQIQIPKKSCYHV